MAPLAALLMLSIINLNAQIEILTNKPKIVTPIIPTMDATISEIISGAEEGTYKFTMASITLGKYQDSNYSYVGSTSIPSKTDKIYNLTKSDDLTARCLFREKSTGSNQVPIFFISTTKIGGKYIKIKHSHPEGFRQLGNIKITKKGEHRFIITADYNNNGSTTNYIFNIFRFVNQ